MTSEAPKEYKILVSEISRGMEQLKQLRASSSSGNQERVLDRMLTSYEEAWLILKGNTSEEQAQSEVTESWDPPGSSVAEQKFPRSSRQRFTQVLDVQSGVLDDGYAWRKYGQKDILGSKYPRAYYRCAYRHTQGCLATKQVQRLDDDVSVEVAYRGKHMCMKPTPVTPPLAFPKSPVSFSESQLAATEKEV